MVHLVHLLHLIVLVVHIHLVDLVGVHLVGLSDWLIIISDLILLFYLSFAEHCLHILGLLVASVVLHLGIYLLVENRVRLGAFLVAGVHIGGCESH